MKVIWNSEHSQYNVETYNKEAKDYLEVGWGVSHSENPKISFVLTIMTNKGKEILKPFNSYNKLCAATL